MSRAYYNEHDPFAAEWLRNLVARELIAPGDVDERSIWDVKPSDLSGYTQHHFFAGIGGWSAALRIAGWPDDEPVWTGSCPCQPFSAAGKGGGFADQRHLWPALHHLVRVCRPPIVFGEQVASRAGLGWLDLVSADLEGEGYACGAADLCAAGVGAPHIRQRLWWVAHRLGERPAREVCASIERGGGVDALAYAKRRSAERQRHDVGGEAAGSGGEARKQRLRVDARAGGFPAASPPPELAARGAGDADFWRDADWLRCRDERWRPVEPGTFPLAYGVPGRVGRLRAYGNAVVPQVAAQFIRAVAQDGAVAGG